LVFAKTANGFSTDKTENTITVANANSALALSVSEEKTARSRFFL